MPNLKKSKSAPAKKPARPAKPAKPAKHAKPAKPAKAAKPAKHSPVRPAAQHKTPAPSKHAPASAKPKPAKPAPAKHQPPKATVPSSSNKPSAKKPVSAKPAKKPAAKPVEPPKAAPKAEPKPAAHAAAAAKAPAAKPAAKPQSKADALRARILERRSAKPIAFTLDEVREVAKVNAAQTGTKNSSESLAAAKQRTAAEELEAKLKKAAQPHHVRAASLADILGYNPAKQSAPTVLSATEIEPRFQRYYKLLIELREHVASGLDTHTEQTLKRSAKDDAGDLSSYAQHMADAGTDTFDRDFALSLVSNEQEALAEIEAAIQRIKNGTYGVCELTGKPISKERLLAVPFARFSVESQTEVEKTRRRSASRAGLFGEGEEGGKIEDDGGGDE